MKLLFTYLLGFALICLSAQLLISCNPWELPERKTKRNCVTPSGTINAPADQLRVNFSIGNSAGTIDAVTWNFGDNTTATTGVTSVSHTYEKAGTYMVTADLTNLCETGARIQQTITVSDAQPPTVTLQPITEYSLTTANARMTVTSNGNATITRYGVCYSTTNQAPEVDKDPTAPGPGVITVGTSTPLSLTGLVPNTPYYIRAFAVNAAGKPGYSATQTFRTGSAPSVATGVFTNLGVTTASVVFVLNNAGNPAAVEYGVLYSTNGTPDVINSKPVPVTSPNVGANTIVNLANLTANTTYYYRSYAKLPPGEIVYGPVQFFKTQVDTVAQGLIAHVTFTDRSLTDLTGNGNNAVLVDRPVFTFDRKGNANAAIELDGTNDYFYMADNSSLRPDALTVSVWIRPNAINNVNDRMQIFNKSKWDDSSSEMYSSLVKKNENGDGLVFMTNIKQNSGCQIAQSWQNLDFSNNPPLGQWYHIVLVYSGRTMRMYFNGTEQNGRTNLPATSIDKCPGGEVKFGAQIRTFPNYFSGAMDDVRIYNRALSTEEVQILFQAAN